MPGRRRRPLRPEERVTKANKAMIPGTDQGRTLNGSRLEWQPNNDSGSGNGEAGVLFYQDREPAGTGVIGSTGVYQTTLSFQQFTDSQDVHLNGIALDEGTDYTIDETGLITFTVGNASSGDVVSIRYAYPEDTLLPVPPDDTTPPTPLYQVKGNQSDSVFGAGFVVGPPAARTPGDLLFCVLTVTSNIVLDAASTANWTPLAPMPGVNLTGTSHRVNIFYKTATNNDATDTLNVLLPSGIYFGNGVMFTYRSAAVESYSVADVGPGMTTHQHRATTQAFSVPHRCTVLYIMVQAQNTGAGNAHGYSWTPPGPTDRLLNDGTRNGFNVSDYTMTSAGSLPLFEAVAQQGSDLGGNENTWQSWIVAVQGTI